MARRATFTLDPVPPADETDARQLGVIDLTGALLIGREPADVRCGHCGVIVMPGYSARGLRTALGGRRDVRGPFFFDHGCGRLLRFVAPA